ncbi:MAG: PAS domain S-box protein [Methanomicrobiaceae archaeon]|nr:PAS domain S-box protein [Methanomicrobiaceae archaeon]
MAPGSTRATGICLLYVDDDPTLLETGKLFLERSSEITVTTAGSAPEALRLLCTKTFDAVVSGYQMPGMDGIEFLRQIRKDYGDLPFIVFTGKGREEVAVEALNCGADFYLQKGGNPQSRFAELSHEIHHAVSRRRAKRALQESEQRYRDIVEDQTELICRFLPDGTHVYANEAYCRYFGQDRGAIIGSRFMPEIHPDDRRAVARVFTSLTPKNPVVLVEHRIVMPDGGIRWMRWSDRAIFGEEGICREYQSVGRDITDRKQAEEELAASRALLNATLDSIPDIIGIQKPDHTIIRYNRAGYEFLHLSPEEVSGRRCYELIGRSSPCEECATEEALRTKRPEQAERYLPKYGIHLDCRANPVLSEDGEIVFIVEQLRDITDKKRAEEELRESEAFNRSLIENLPDYIVIYGSGGRLLYMNSSAAHALGYSADEVIGRPVISFIAEESRDNVASMITARREGGDVPAYEIEILTREGDRRAVIVKGTPIQYRDSPATLLVVTDITDRKRTEEALKKSRQRLELALEAGEHGFWDWDLETNEVYFSPRCYTMLGYEPGAFPPHYQSWLDLLHPDDLREVVPRISRCIQAMQPYGEAFRMRCRDGSWKWISSRGKIFRKDGSGVLCRVVGVHVDIDERRRADAALLESEAKYRLLADRMNDIIWMLDADLRTTYVSPSVEAMLGFTPEERLNQEISEQLTPASMLTVQDVLARERALEQGGRADPGRSVALELEYCRKDGSTRWLESLISGIRNDQGRLVGFHGVSRDITDRRRAEVSLQIANKKLQLLASITRHDILNRMMVLQGYLELMQESLNQPVQREYLRQIKKAATAIQRQIEFTREYEQLGHALPIWQSVSGVVAKACRGRLPVRCTCKRLFIYADPMLEAVFANLMDNTLRHGEGAAEVRVYCRASEDGVTIVWEDDGAGVPADQKERVFDRGFGRNTGFGLFLCREILSITGICIIETGTYGQGARFEMAVPEGQYSFGERSADAGNIMQMKERLGSPDG